MRRTGSLGVAMGVRLGRGLVKRGLAAFQMALGSVLEGVCHREASPHAQAGGPHGT